MRFDEEARKCVVFLCLSENSFVGTAFLVGVTSQKSKMVYSYLVTAKHVAEGLTNKPFFVRMNDTQGSCKYIRVEATNWYYHPSDDAADVAVLPFGFDWEMFDFKMEPLEHFVTDDMIQKEKIGASDEVLITGLFVSATGSRKNQPIVRMGNIAMIPDERIPTKYGNIEAYLIEARSIGGISGSPVFVSARGERRTYLLGLIQAHWEILPEMINDAYHISDSERVNIGIAVVVPAKKIRETIYRPELIELRKKEDSE
jgi:hypothetical protein